MISAISICNSALDKLGQSSIVSFGDRDNNSRLCARNYYSTRDELLRKHPWNFATDRKTLSASIRKPPWGFEHLFPLPHSCLRLLEVRNVKPEDFQLEQNEILANTDSLEIRYIRRVSDPTIYDLSFVGALSYSLAVKLSKSISVNAEERKLLISEARKTLNEARRIDAQENPVILTQEDDWITVRL